MLASMTPFQLHSGKNCLNGDVPGRSAGAASGSACISQHGLPQWIVLHCWVSPATALLKADSSTNLGTTLSGTSQRCCPAGLILTCSLLGVSGMTCTVSCLKLSPYSGKCSFTSARSISVCKGPAEQHQHGFCGSQLLDCAHNVRYVACNPPLSG